MFCVVYKFNPKPGREERFIECWKQMTALIKVELGGLGSRLHRTENGELFAYAEWPSRERWEAMRTSDESPEMAQLSRKWAEVADPSDTVFAGEVESDLLGRVDPGS